MRTILHADLNSFYASVECLYHPELRDHCVAVGGHETQRHGIVLAKNQHAKDFGIKTGETLTDARRKCPQLVVVPPNFPLYLKVSRLARAIYGSYSDRVESFGIDEAWIDLSGHLHGRSGKEVADEIRARIYEELGVTVSVGVSWNKIFAKFGSDYKKPNATTVITPDNMADIVWPAPVEDLLYVGRSTKRKLERQGIDTIGELAAASPEVLHRLLGKWGLVLHRFANGWDDALVAATDAREPVKSIGNSTTTYRDLSSFNDVRIVLTVLTESVAMRLRENGLRAGGIVVHARGKSLARSGWQRTLLVPTASTGELIAEALSLFQECYDWREPLRSIGVRAIRLSAAEGIQRSLFEEVDGERKEALASAVDDVRRRFGNHSLVRAVLLEDRTLSNIDPKEEHVIHPLALF